MIEFTIEAKSASENGPKRELAHVRIEKVSQERDAEYADYSVQIALDTASGIALYQRAVYSFPRKQYNIIGLLKSALESIDEEELRLDGDPDAPRSPGVARRLSSALRTF